MPRPALKKDTLTEQTRRYMKKLGVYRPEYDQIVTIYAGLLEEYRRLDEQFRKSGCKVSTETSDGNEKKAAIVGTLENLRKDILQYSDRLCINPRAMKEFEREPEKAESALDKALKELSGIG